NVHKYSSQQTPSHQHQPSSSWLNDTVNFPYLNGTSKHPCHEHETNAFEKISQLLITTMEKRFQQLVKQLKKEIRSTNKQQQQQTAEEFPSASEEYVLDDDDRSLSATLKANNDSSATAPSTQISTSTTPFKTMISSSSTELPSDLIDNLLNSNPLPK
ncbi:unnamed protein product, partial [Didymodactylos carnosus]